MTNDKIKETISSSDDESEGYCFFVGRIVGAVGLDVGCDVGKHSVISPAIKVLPTRSAQHAS
jgi:hypothetical protein